MLDIFTDFESRATISIEEGIDRYSREALPLMLAYGSRSVGYRQWFLPLPYDGSKPPIPDDLKQWVLDPEVIFHAFNATFEMYVWARCCVAKWGWPAIPLERWRCTKAKGCYANMPRYLDGVPPRLGLDKKYWKDKKGKELIQQLSCPTKLQVSYEKNILGPDGKPLKRVDKPRLNQKVVNTLSKQYAEEIGAHIFYIPGKPGEYFFREDPPLMKDYRSYNVQDIVSEEEVDCNLPEVPKQELEVWRLDRKINARGIPIDRKVCEGAVSIIAQERECIEEAVTKLTGGEVTAGTQVQRIATWVNNRVNFGESLAKEYIEEFLDMYKTRPDRWGQLNASEEDIRGVLQILELRLLVSGSAVAKYNAALTQAGPDDRCREQLNYYGAGPGRWTGWGLQPHNFKRTETPDETAITTIAKGDWEECTFHSELMGYHGVLDMLAACVRGLIHAPDGRKLVVSDFAGIESRVLHWLVGAEHRLQLFRDDVDPYKYTATKIFDGTTIDTITKAQRQVGKGAELGLGYGMGWRTFLKNALRAGQDIDEAFAQYVVKTWRSDNRKVQSFWYDLDKAAKSVIRKGRRMKRKHAIRFGKLYLGYDAERDFFLVRLPSGRSLVYPYPIVVDDDRDGQIYYKDGTKTGPADMGQRISTYGGKFTENIVQALARDLLCYSLGLIDAAGVDLIFHVHDESISEVDEHDTESFGIVHKSMETLPSWADGLPLKAETYESKRYRK